LSPQAQSVLRAASSFKREADGSRDLVFPGELGVFSGWSKSKARLDGLSAVNGWTLHDLRRTTATGLQKLGVRLEVTESVLNHVSGSRAGIVGVYQRHDWAEEKRAALNAWGEHMAAIAEGRTAAGNVTRLRRSA
jgi:integrase